MSPPSTDDERFERGVELMRQMVGDEAADQAIANHRSTARTVPDEMMDWAVENAFGFLLQRPGLALRDKALVMLGSDIASMASRDALHEHTRLALHCGVAPDELYEIAFLLVWYGGMPRVREALVVISNAVNEFAAEAPQDATEG